MLNLCAQLLIAQFMSPIKIGTSQVNNQGDEELLQMLEMVNLAKMILEELSDRRIN